MGEGFGRYRVLCGTERGEAEESEYAYLFSHICSSTI